MPHTNEPYTCWNARKDIESAAELVRKARNNCKNKTMRASITQVLNSLTPLADKVIYYYEAEDKQKGLFK